VVIRPYQEADRDSVFAIAADTAFFGDPVEAYMEDRSLFCDLLYRYYTIFERDLGLVVDDGEGVSGFLLGCGDSRAVRARWLRAILPGVLGRLVRGKYQIGPRTRRFGLATARATLRHGRPHADLACYPAHLHMNLLPSTRGQGLGRQLLEAYLQQLRTRGVPGVHLNTTDFNVAACHLYERVGFELLDARATTAWKNLIATPVENRCYGLRL
jgi:GNAT superfamily N-acetyltransferase